MVWLSAHGVCGFQHLFYKDRCLIAQNAQSTVVGEQRQVNTDDRLRLGRSLALPSGSSVGPLSTSLGMAVRQYSSAEANNAPMGGQLPGLCGNRWPGRNDARDKSRSLGFSPGTNFASLLKSPMFLKDGAEQECSVYGFGRTTTREDWRLSSARREPRPPEGGFCVA